MSQTKFLNNLVGDIRQSVARELKTELAKAIAASPLKDLAWSKSSFPMASRKASIDRFDDQESMDMWGFEDSGFELLKDRSVIFSGFRYPLSQQKLTRLVPWIENLMGIRLDSTDLLASNYPPAIPESRLQDTVRHALEHIFRKDQLVQDPLQRLRHGHGHTQEEMYAIKFADGLKRIPDIVVYPDEEGQILQLIELAKEQALVLVPFGGGTSVTEALRCPDSEQRTIVSVDMKQMNRMLWIDPVNRMACIQAGAVGRHIVKMLADKGFTLGHEPDSIEFSTLGGWIATHASGMKKNKYGNIEDLVLDMHVATSQGLMTRSSQAPRESIGIDLKRMMFGSEGNLGIITQAVVKISPLPEVQKYGSFIFPCFEDGVNFMYDVAQSGHVPASVRLVDNIQFQFGQALKPEAEPAQALKSKLEKLYVTKVRGLNPETMVACTLVYEGLQVEVQKQEETLRAIAIKHHGIDGGEGNGQRGYQLTFGIAYIRDMVMKHHVIAESFETSVSWNRVIELCERVKRKVAYEHSRLGLQGKPFVSCRVTQIYPTGVCVYFYLAVSAKGLEDPSKTFAAIEHSAREEILSAGGSLSHHHGIGKIRQEFLPQIMSEAHLKIKESIKMALDPDGIFAINNQKIVTH